jgi:hypothetical protein
MVNTTDINFPNPTLTPLCDNISNPRFETIQVAQLQLNANAASVHSNGGDGQLGHLALTITPAAYTAISAGHIPFVAPENPPVHPEHPPGATAAQISEINRQHKENQTIFRQYHAIDNALRNQLIAAVPHIYISTLSDPTVGFGNVTCLDILTHLRTNYGTITSDELDKNMIRMKTPWHPPVSIEAMFQQIEDGVKFATAGNDAPSANTIVRIGYNIIYATGRFTIGCHEWRKLTDAQKTWAQLKTHFKAADTDLRLTTTSNSAGYDGAANHVQASDDNSTALATSQAALAASQAALAAALQGQANLVTSTPAATSTRRTSYCWTHGIMRNTRHTSATCHTKAEGHQDTATKDNKLGGSTKAWTPSV